MSDDASDQGADAACDAPPRQTDVPDDVFAHMVELRRAVHRRPELSGHEHETAAAVVAHKPAVRRKSRRVTPFAKLRPSPRNSRKHWCFIRILLPVLQTFKFRLWSANFILWIA